MNYENDSQIPTKIGSSNRLKKALLCFAPLAIVAIGLALFLYFCFDQTRQISLQTSQINQKPPGAKNTFEAGWEAARMKLEQSGLLRPEPAEIFTVTGTITAMTNNKITLRADPTVTNPLAEQSPEERIITVTANAKIIRQTTKSPDDFAAEMEKYRQDASNLKPDETPPVPPSAFITEEIKLSDLKTGDTISVTSDTNIKMAAEFTAKEISVSVAPERPAPPTP